MPSPASTPLPAPSRRPWAAAALIVFAGLIAYLPTLHNGFVWDDDTFLTRNPLIRAPDGLWRFWFTTQPSDYWPVTSTTLWLEWRLWGEHALGYHLTNLVLHVAECLLLWRILLRLRVPGAALAALLFAVHPVNVESVAWIAQRKNLVAMLFYLLSIDLFVQAEGVPRSGPPAAAPCLRPYCLSLLAFALAMLAKGSVAPLPIVLLGLIAWRRKIERRDLRLLAPFFAVAGILALVNVWFQTHGSGEIIRHATALERLLGAGAAIWFYLGKALWPVHLAFVYPLWPISAGDWRWWLPLTAAIVATAVLVKAGRGAPSFWRSALFAWLYYVVLLLPALGFTDVYFMRYSLVADHYQHLALIGLVSLAGAGWSRWPAPAVFRHAAAAVVVALLAALTWRQSLAYRDAETLYRATLNRNPEAWMVYNNLGELRLHEGRLAEAQADFESALRLNPGFAEAHVNLGTLAAGSGDLTRALREDALAIAERPGFAKAYYNAGIALHGLGRSGEARAAFERAIELEPDYAEAEGNLGVVLAEAGRPAEAEACYRRAIALDPGYAEAHVDLGNLFAAEGRPADAAAEYALALSIRPDNPDAERDLGLVLQRSGRVADAIAHFERALRLRPDFKIAHNDLGIAYAQTGRLDLAASEFEAALRLDPNYASARRNLDRVRQLTGR